MCALGWVKCRAQIPRMGHHTWPHVTSLTHSKRSRHSSDMIRGAIKNKLSTCSLRWGPSNICTKMRMSCLNQMRQSEVLSLPFVLTTESSVWTMSESERASVYCIQCRQDSGRDSNFYFLLTRHDTRIQCDQVPSREAAERQWAGPMVRRRLFIDILKTSLLLAYIEILQHFSLQILVLYF